MGNPRMIVSMVFAALLATIATDSVSSDSRSYVGTRDDDGRVRPPDCDPTGTVPGSGLVCWPAGHIVPSLWDDAVLTIADAVTGLASGTYCQDLDDDLVCGEAFPSTNLRVEPYLDFCQSVTLQKPIDMTARPAWTTNNWNDFFPVYVAIDGPIRGNPSLSSCGTFSAGASGEVHHT